MTSEAQPTRPVRRAPAQRPDVDARLFWSWVWQSVHPVLGWALVVLGLVVIGFGWWGVANNAIVAKQLPYLASGGIIGLALVTLGGRFLMIQDLRQDSGRLDRLEQMVHELHEILLTSAEAQAQADATREFAPDDNGVAHANGGRAAGSSTYLVLPEAETYHRSGCAMLQDKDDVSRIRAATVARRNLRPCPLCEPVPAQV